MKLIIRLLFLMMKKKFVPVDALIVLSIGLYSAFVVFYFSED